LNQRICILGPCTSGYEYLFVMPMVKQKSHRQG